MESFPAFQQLERLVHRLAPHARIETPVALHHENRSYPLYTIVLGSRSPEAPVLGLTGGVHGLERIGSEVVLSYLDHILERLPWDETLQWQLERMKLMILPIVNPIGMKRFTRCNANGVDLMRNSPIEAEKATWLVGGHRISRLLPWHRGDRDRMEVEAQTLCDFIRKECFGAPHSIIVDVHSGFGMVDQLWFPYAGKKAPFPNLPEVGGLKQLLDRVLPNHVYRFEPQAVHYTTHGDLWDYLYEEFRKASGPDSDQGKAAFLPLTLELGSWNWVRKNPFQLFYLSGHYNPIKPHRQRRALRRHLPLFEFFAQAVISSSPWKTGPGSEREAHRGQALSLWYDTP